LCIPVIRWVTGESGADGGLEALKARAIRTWEVALTDEQEKKLKAI
jgi:hypothetical protein